MTIAPDAPTTRNGHAAAALLTVELPSGVAVPARITPGEFRTADDAVVVDHPDRLDVLRRLDEYPHVRSLLDPGCLDRAVTRRAEVRDWLTDGAYVFGAYKVGLKIARQVLSAGVAVHGFLDNDPAKHGTTLAGIPVAHPDSVDLRRRTVLVMSGRHGVAIKRQLESIGGVRIVNMPELQYALNLPHGADPEFAEFVHGPQRETMRYLAAFARLDDERSRQVFDRLIGMRTTLSIDLAEDAKSPFDDEYFEAEFVTAEQAARFVDAGAAAGDTLQRLERHFGPVEQAWLFEPELPPYYEALRAFADRPEVFVFNMGLDETRSRAVYAPALSYDIAGEMSSAVPLDITSYIQGVQLDSVVPGHVGLFKLDIEGMEQRALAGAHGVIRRDRPTIAVCAYHRNDDYWRLMDEVLAVRPDYRVGIRLYSDILEDITLYFY